jgi:glycerol kinase
VVVRALAIDVGSSSIRTALVNEEGEVSFEHRRHLHVATPSPGFVELNPEEIVTSALELAALTLANSGGCDSVAITNQRATTIVFDPVTGEAVGPAISWQDLRTVIDCLIFQGEGLRLAPNQSATKIRWLLQQTSRPASELRFATIETWLAWHLTRGETYVSDRTNASVNGLINESLDGWDERTLRLLELEDVGLPELVDTTGSFGVASALSGAPPLVALMGDQPASLFGQSCVRHGAKITFGTGAMLDMVHASSKPTSLRRFASGCYPTALRSADDVVTWGIEGIVFSAGSCVEWLADLGLLDEPRQSDEVARSVSSSEGVSFVPAFSGLGTPQWDFGARAGFFGITRGTTKAHLVRAVLEGVAQRGADLLDAAEREIGTTLHELRVDGGMSANEFFVQHLADVSGHVVSVSSEREATARGAGLLALVSTGDLTLDDVEELWTPAFVATPQLSEDERVATREQWSANLARVEKTLPDLSSVSF